MLDYGALPPEINSARMYSGPGSTPLMAAAAAWDVLANGLDSVSRGYASVITRLHGESWSGGAAVAMTNAVTPYVSWVTAAGVQAEETAARLVRRPPLTNPLSRRRCHQHLSRPTAPNWPC